MKTTVTLKDHKEKKNVGEKLDKANVNNFNLAGMIAGSALRLTEITFLREGSLVTVEF